MVRLNLISSGLQTLGGASAILATAASGKSMGPFPAGLKARGTLRIAALAIAKASSSFTRYWRSSVESPYVRRALGFELRVP